MPQRDPIVLPPNQPPHFYRGGGNISAFRGIQAVGDRRPEDWVGSVTTRFGDDCLGLTTLSDQLTLREAIRADPVGWLGPTRRDTGVLVKLLDPAQRLPVHCHPSREYAKDHLSSPYGKTEAWVILGGRGDVHLGFREDVDGEQLQTWVRSQDHRALLRATNRVEVAPGDTVVIPAGLPHAIDGGIFLVELQEPTDFSVLIEWEGFADDTSGHLGLGWDVALQCVDRRAWSQAAVDGLISRLGHERVFPPEMDRFFRAEYLTGRAHMTPGFAVLIVLGGSGQITWDGGVLDVRKGQTILVPYGAGDLELRGEAEVLRCLPPKETQEPEE